VPGGSPPVLIRRPGRPGRSSGRFSPPAAPERIEALGRAFLTEYLRHRPLGDADIAAIPAFVAIRQIWLVGLHVSLGDRFGWGWMNDRYFDCQLKVLRDWESNFLDRPRTRGCLRGQAELRRPFCVCFRTDFAAA
jgi:hypothetical protein